jgi:NIMA (never in mitosis gene a)-related kinase
VLTIYLGEGSFSEVYQVTRKSDNAVYAMKKVKMQKLSSKEKENALNEVRILASISHPNVIGYKEAFFEDSTNSLCIVMENADGGDILQLITNKKKNNDRFGEKQIWHYFI